MAGYTLIGKNQLIPRLTFPARRRIQVKSQSTSPYENTQLTWQIEEFMALECSVQPVTGRAIRDYTQQINLEGYKDHDAFIVYSTTFLADAKEGTNVLPDQIQLPDSNGRVKWFTVLKTDQYVTAGVARYQSYVVAMPED